MYEAIMLVTAIGFMLCFPFYCEDKGYFIKVDNQTGNVNYTYLVVAMIIIGLIGIVTMYIAHSMIKMYEDRFTHDLDSESIYVDGKRLYYSFNIKDKHGFIKHQVIVVDLQRLDSIGYDDEENTVCIYGMMAQKEIKEIPDMYLISNEDMEKNVLSIFDNFTPFLHETLDRYMKEGCMGEYIEKYEA
jgi:hypothetical protein